MKMPLSIVRAFSTLNAMLAVAAVAQAQAQAPAPAPAPAKITSKMKWWQDSRFGMFIHWGPISLDGQEISWSRNPNPSGPNPGGIPAKDYDSLYKSFNPTKFDAKAIVAMAKATGMKYICFTCKHHDGFCEFDSQYTDYKITSPQSPYRKDIVRQLADATHKAGLHWCVYYSQPDLHQPDYISKHSRYDNYFHDQVKELLTKYGPVDVLWFDGLGKDAAWWDAEHLFDDIHKISPQTIINNRCGLSADYDTPEQHIGTYNDQRPWETCMTIGDQWSFKPNDNYKSSQQCIQTLAKCVGGDGNLLLNIGPRPDGTVDPTQADRLKAIGDWMKVNSESVYGTRGGPYLPSNAFASTRKGKTIYVHLFQKGATAILPPLPAKVLKATLMGGAQIAFEQAQDSLKLNIGSKSREDGDTVVKLQLKDDAMAIPLIATATNGFINIKASNVYQGDSNYGPQMAFDGDPSTRWATDVGTKQCWISADLTSPTDFDLVQIFESYPGRIKSFRFFTKGSKDGDWKLAASGTGQDLKRPFRIGPGMIKSIKFEVLDATEGPTISEIQLTGVRG